MAENMGEFVATDNKCIPDDACQENEVVRAASWYDELKICRDTAVNWSRKYTDFPKPFYISRLKYFRRVDCDKFIAARVREGNTHSYFRGQFKAKNPETEIKMEAVT